MLQITDSNPLTFKTIMTMIVDNILFSSGAHQKDLSDLMVIGDSVRLTQVFRNVVSNSMKFSKPGGKVTIKAVWYPSNLLKQG